ncbi:CD1375 family protein [Clostridium carboxidivorans]|nr:CD1375 family protein [Clostridium carboxidivorans]
MVELYADLVELGLRTLEPETGKIQVPAFLHDKVKAELDRRKASASN